MENCTVAQPFFMHYEKVCVEVSARFLRKGGLRPTELVWADGRRYSVSGVVCVDRAPSRVTDLLPMRFTCLICGREKYLWFEPEAMRWFVELELP